MVFKLNSRQSQSFSAKSSRWQKRKFLLLLSLMAIGAIAGYRLIKGAIAQPEAIIVLGGEEKRELFAARFAHQHPDLPIWVSSGSPEGYAKLLFAKLGIEGDRINLDYQAKDTVTNFTTLVDRLEAQGVDSVYLVTSDDHMRRARVVGEIVFGSRGIIIKPVIVPTNREPEAMTKSVRDGARALLWLTTGYTGATLKSQSQVVFPTVLVPPQKAEQ
ncbi:MAG: YdcF family protein [Jaaginema sp. PMC 1079.18]|nr:YdcF family protein [Jaaginema sp. PMC 1080.18]MEC4850453.1 YdcF family protein [Jaaginema sp. PMC 1079.18]MEC4867517.1 YdcF family protein [Jaaginema sp. PMC 1078.18]